MWLDYLPYMNGWLTFCMVNVGNLFSSSMDPIYGIQNPDYSVYLDVPERMLGFQWWSDQWATDPITIGILTSSYIQV